MANNHFEVRIVLNYPFLFGLYSIFPRKYELVQHFSVICSIKLGIYGN